MSYKPKIRSNGKLFITFSEDKIKITIRRMSQILICSSPVSICHCGSVFSRYHRCILHYFVTQKSRQSFINIVSDYFPNGFVYDIDIYANRI